MEKLDLTPFDNLLHSFESAAERLDRLERQILIGIGMAVTISLLSLALILL